MNNNEFNPYDSIDTLNKSLSSKIKSSNISNKIKMKKINLKERNRRALGIPNRNISHSLIINKNNANHKNLADYKSFNTNSFDLNEWKQKLALSECKSTEYFSENSQSKFIKMNSKCEDYINRYIVQNPKLSKMKEIFCKKDINIKINNNIITERSVKGNHDIKISQNINRKNTDHSSSKLSKSTIIDKNEVKRIFKLEEFKKPLKIDLFLDNMKFKHENLEPNEKKSQEKQKSDPDLKLFRNSLPYSSNSHQTYNGIKIAFDHYKTTGTIARWIKFIK